MTKMHKSLLFAGAALGAVAMPAAGFAQDAAPANERDGVVLDEIVVTADRTGTEVVQVGSFRGAKQLDTPLTIAVIPRDVLDTQQASSLIDALRNTAGVTTSQTAPTVYNNMAIRGIDVENRGNYRLNGTLPIVNLTDLPLEDKERVEALKGASALYYGFTTPSGIINLIMKRPTQDPLLALKVFGNSHGRIGGHVDFGGTTGILGYRINAVYDRPDSGIDHTRGRRTLIAGAFDIKPTDNLTIQLDGEHIFKKVNEPGIYRFILVPAATPTNLNPAITIPALIDPHTNFGPDWAFNRTEATNVLAKAIWKFSPAWEFVASAGLAQLERARHFNTIDPNNPNTNPANGPVGEFPLSISYQPVAKYRNLNYRAEIAGAFETFGIKHELLSGGPINRRSNRSSASTAQTCFYNTATGALLGAGFPTTPVPAGATRQTCRQSITNPHPIPQLGEPLPNQNNPTEITDKGLFLFDRMEFTEWLQVLGGIRISDYQEKRLDTGVKTFSAKPNSLSFGAVLKPVESVSIYGTYIEGLESTPAAPTTAVNANEQLPPSQSTQYEAGVKWEPWRGFLFQAAYFNIKRDSEVINGANRWVKDGRSTYKGVELSATGNVTPDWSVYASALFLDAKYTSGSPTILTPTISPTIVGNRIENAPKRAFSLATEYRFTDMLPGFSLNAAVYHTGNRAINSRNQAFIPGHTLFDVGAGYSTDIAGVDTTFRISAENVTGKRHWASTAGLLLSQAAPSTVKFSVETTFY